MTLQIKDGALLLDSGSLANHEDCCCEEETGCLNCDYWLEVSMGAGSGTCCSEYITGIIQPQNPAADPCFNTVRLGQGASAPVCHLMLYRIWFIDVTYERDDVAGLHKAVYRVNFGNSSAGDGDIYYNFSRPQNCSDPANPPNYGPMSLDSVSIVDGFSLGLQACPLQIDLDGP